MRIRYRNFKGQIVTIEFHDWRTMMVWLKRWYPLIKIGEVFGEVLRS